MSGEILGVRMDNAGTAVTTGGTADFTFTRGPDGGTVLALSNVAAPFEYRVGQQLYSTAGGSVICAAGTDVYADGVPVFGTVTMTVAQAAGTASGTVYLYYRRTQPFAGDGGNPPARCCRHPWSRSICQWRSISHWGI